MCGERITVYERMGFYWCDKRNRGFYWILDD